MCYTAATAQARANHKAAARPRCEGRGPACCCCAPANGRRLCSRAYLLPVTQGLLWIAREGLKAPLPQEWKPW
jgi:hypothetical protein